MARGPVLNISIAEKRFPGTGPLLRDFQLTLAQGGVTALLGPSGIGKSTLLRLIAGIDTEYDGTIHVDGIEAAKAPRPGFVFQDPRLLPWLTAMENIRLADAGMAPEHAAALLVKVGLSGWEEAFPAQLSGGMQRRVALARALATNAKLLLLDEPFVSLDPDLVGEMRLLMAQVFETESPTALLVSHTPEDAAQLADRVIVLDGRPARIAFDLELPAPRTQRTRTVLDDYLQKLTPPRLSQA